MLWVGLGLTTSSRSLLKERKAKGQLHIQVVGQVSMDIRKIKKHKIFANTLYAFRKLLFDTVNIVQL